MERAKILVVDDEKQNEKTCEGFPQQEKGIGIGSRRRMEAMDLFYEEKDIALIILDVMMPKMDGWQVCREVRETSKVPIIMLTARSEERDELQGFELGVDEYISKPFSPKILVAREMRSFAELWERSAMIRWRQAVLRLTSQHIS